MHLHLQHLLQLCILNRTLRSSSSSSCCKGRQLLTILPLLRSLQPQQALLGSHPLSSHLLGPLVPLVLLLSAFLPLALEYLMLLPAAVVAAVLVAPVCRVLLVPAQA